MTIPDPENPTRVQRATPMDVTAIRDPGMKALVLLAASLGWNIIHKPNNPILLKARDGRERRIPTNTSIRMSVFQANLSTILTHSPGFEPTAGLIDDIVRKTKVDRDHERRLRISVTEPAEIHEARVANAERGAPDIPKGEHLTQRLVVPKDEPEEQVEQTAPRSQFTPFDKGSHGRLISRHPFMAKYHGTRTKPGLRYPSESSYERVWEDDYKDYECMHCGMIKGSPQAVGSHKQVHVKAGEIVASPPSAVMARTKGKPVQTEVVTAGDGEAAIRVSKLAAPAATEAIATDAEMVLAQILDLVAPKTFMRIADLQREAEDLRVERDELQVKYDALEANLNALRELLGGLQ